MTDKEMVTFLCQKAEDAGGDGTYKSDYSTEVRYNVRDFTGKVEGEVIFAFDKNGNILSIDGYWYD